MLYINILFRHYVQIFNNSILVENIECDSRVDYYGCGHFTLYHIYAFAAKVPPSGAGVSLIKSIAYNCMYVYFQGIYH